MVKLNELNDQIKSVERSYKIKMAKLSSIYRMKYAIENDLDFMEKELKEQNEIREDYLKELNSKNLNLKQKRNIKLKLKDVNYFISFRKIEIRNSKKEIDKLGDKSKKLDNEIKNLFGEKIQLKKELKKLK